MGDPRKIKAKYSGPGHPWQKVRIDEEKSLKKEYGLKNKKEIWKHASKLKNFASQAKRLVALRTKQADKEKKQLIARLNRMGIVSSEADTEAVLGLAIKDILERRLQTIVYRKGLANSMNQARQFISHGHITVSGKLVKTPSYLVRQDELQTVAFVEASALANQDHPERQIKKTETATSDAEKKKDIAAKKGKDRRKITRKRNDKK